jgi:heme-degrading monooxygenase HmoA
VMISITSSQVTTKTSQQVEAFLQTFLPKMRRFPGVIAIYHFARPDQGDEKTIAIWESAEALKAYRESDLVKEAIAFEKKMGLPSAREAYPIINAW